MHFSKFSRLFICRHRSVLSQKLKIMHYRVPVHFLFFLVSSNLLSSLMPHKFEQILARLASQTLNFVLQTQWYFKLWLDILSLCHILEPLHRQWAAVQSLIFFIYFLWLFIYLRQRKKFMPCYFIFWLGVDVLYTSMNINIHSLTNLLS